MSKKRRMILWCNEADHEFLCQLAERELTTVSAIVRRLLKILNSAEVRKLTDLERSLGVEERELKSADAGPH